VENKMRCRFLPPRQLCAYGLVLLIVGPLFAQAAGPDDDKPVVSRAAARPRPQTSSDAGGPNLQFVPGALHIIAGTYGKVGDTGDGGSATSAQIAVPVTASPSTRVAICTSATVPTTSSARLTPLASLAPMRVQRRPIPVMAAMEETEGLPLARSSTAPTRLPSTQAATCISHAEH
jgi:hypothetical protein